MLLCKVTINEAGRKVFEVFGNTFGNMDELIKDMRNNPETFKEDVGFTLIKKRPILTLRKKDVFSVLIDKGENDEQERT